jgi:hypothetical protein
VAAEAVLSPDPLGAGEDFCFNLLGDGIPLGLVERLPGLDAGNGLARVRQRDAATRPGKRQVNAVWIGFAVVVLPRWPDPRVEQ